MGEVAADTSNTTEMLKVDAARAAVLTGNLQAVRERLAAAVASSGRRGETVRLVAVSKLKPANDILALHDPSSAGAGQGKGQAQAPQLHFGENYAQELRDKAMLLPRTIQWHFIGGLQSGHCKNLARIPNLFCVSSVDSLKKAKLLDSARGAFLKDSAAAAAAAAAAVATPAASDAFAAGPLHVHVQVNTSGEDSKSGCAPGDETVALCRAIVDECPHLRLIGLMTIGAIARSKAVATAETPTAAENPDFVALCAQRDLVQAALQTSASAGAADRVPARLELSMGMSDDFVSAVASGSDEVRVGSTIFGQRPAKADAKLVST